MPQTKGPVISLDRRLGSWQRGLISSRTALICLILLALVATVGVADRVFERIPHTEDELAFVFQARTLAMGRLYAPIPERDEFFTAPFIIARDGKWFGKYPPGYPLILSLGTMVDAPWLVNPIAGSLALLVTYLIAGEVYDSRTGLIVVGLGVVSPFFLILTGSLMSHATAMLCMALFALFFLKTLRNHSIIHPMLAGTCLGLAFLNRQLTAVSLALPFALYAMATLSAGWRRVIDYGLMTASFLVFVGILLWYNNTLTSSPFRSPYELYWDFDKIGFGKGIGSLGEHTLQLGLMNTKDNLDLLSHQLFGWPGRLSLLFIFAPFLLLKVRTADLLFLLSFVSLAGFYVLYWASGVMYGPRYYFEGLPMLLLLSARGIVVMGERLTQALTAAGSLLGSRNSTRRHGDTGVSGPTLHGRRTTALSGGIAPALGWGMVGAFTLIMIGIGLTTYLPKEFAHWYEWYGMSSRPLQAVKQAGIHHALVFVVQERGWVDYGEVFPANSPTLDSDIVYAIDQGLSADFKLAERYFPGRQTYILRGTHVDRLEGRATPSGED